MLMLSVIAVDAQKKAIITFDKTMGDFGKINEEKGKVFIIFNFTNTGNDTLKVTEAKPSCGCITTEWTKTPVAAGQKGIVKVFYDPLHRPGLFEKSVWVHSNADVPELTLNIKGEVIAKIKTLQDSFPVKNGNLMLGGNAFYLRNINNKEIKKDSIFLYNPGNKIITLSFKNIPSNVSCKAKPTSLGPKQRGKICITYDAAKKNEYGIISDTITVVTNDTINPNKKLAISATIVDDFSKLTPEQKANAPKITFSSDNIDFGKVKTGEIVKRTFDFYNNGKDTLFIRKATPYFQDCKITIDGKSAIAGGESGKISIEFNTAGVIGDQKRTILITTNDPNRAFSILVIKGSITP